MTPAWLKAWLCYEGFGGELGGEFAQYVTQFNPVRPSDTYLHKK